MKHRVIFCCNRISVASIYAAYQAHSSGFEVVFIGPFEEGQGLVDIETVSLKSFDPELGKAFREVFDSRYLVNPQEFEFFNFLRWYYIAEYMRRQTGKESVRYFALDHDMLVYPGFESLWQIGGDRLLPFCWSTPVDVDSLERLCDFFVSVYSDSTRLEGLARKYHYEGIPNASDMNFFFEFAEVEPEICFPLDFRFMERIGFSHNINGVDGYFQNAAMPSVKDMRYIEGQLYWVGKDPVQFIPIRSIHFQGQSKPLMALYHTINSKYTLPPFPPEQLSPQLHAVIAGGKKGV